MNSSCPLATVIVVCAQGQGAPFLASLKEQRFKGPYEIIHAEGGSRSQAKNLALSHAAFQLMVFTDSDCEAPPDWLSNLVERLPKDESVAGVGGVSLKKPSSSSLQTAIEGVFSTYLGSLGSPSLASFPRNKKSLVRALSGHNCMFRKHALLQVGGFDERFQLNEDTDICARLREKGYSLQLDENVFVFHLRRASLRAFISQFFQYGIGRMRSMLTSTSYADTRILGFLLLVLVSGLTTLVHWIFPAAAMLGYLIAVLLSSTKGAKRIRSLRMTPVLFLLFMVEHFAYLFGMLYGVFLGPWSEVQRQQIKFKKYVVGPPHSSALQ